MSEPELLRDLITRVQLIQDAAEGLLIDLRSLTTDPPTNQPETNTQPKAGYPAIPGDPDALTPGSVLPLGGREALDWKPGRGTEGSPPSPPLDEAKRAWLYTLADSRGQRGQMWRAAITAALTEADGLDLRDRIKPLPQLARVEGTSAHGAGAAANGVKSGVKIGANGRRP